MTIRCEFYKTVCNDCIRGCFYTKIHLETLKKTGQLNKEEKKVAE